MDYTTQPISFKARKAFRYLRLYGPAKTRVKVEAYYHMRRRFREPPAEHEAPSSTQNVGLIGCGKFAFSHIAYYLAKNYGPVIRGAMDLDVHRAASLFRKYGLSYYTDDAARIIEDDSIELVYIASNHASHAEYAINAMHAGKNVHIEKPHVVSHDQLRRLCLTMMDCPARVALGFNRPHSPLGREIRTALDSAEGPLMLNWFVAGHEIAPEHWYFRPEEGGRILGNLCHWTDFVLQLIPKQHRYPITITPTRGGRADADIAVGYAFGDESVAAITFSAKGHSFEGVKERFAAHRGDVLLTMDDFRRLTIEVGPRKRRRQHIFRNHGHEAMIMRSYELVRADPSNAPGAAIGYVWETGELFLKTREALERNEVVTVESFSEDALRSASAHARVG